MKEINNIENMKENMLETLKRIDCEKNDGCILITKKEIGSTFQTLNIEPMGILRMFGSSVEGYLRQFKKEEDRKLFLETLIGFLETFRGE